MGVGNYMFRHTDFAQTCLSIDAIEQSFEDAQEEAFDTLMAHLKQHPEDAPDNFEPENWQASELEVLCKKIIDRTVWEDLIDNDVVYGYESYYQNKGEQSWDDLKEQLLARLRERGINTECAQVDTWSEHHYSNRDQYLVIGRGKFCEVGIKQWQHMYYLGAQPKNAVDNYEKTIQECSGPVMEQWQQRLAALALLVNANDALLREVAGAQTHVFPDRVKEDLESHIYSHVGTVGVIDRLLVLAEEAVEAGAQEQFAQDFGFEADDVLADRDMLYSLQEVWVEVGHLPKAIEIGYAQEHAAMSEAITLAAFDVSNDVYSSHGGYTSTRVQRPEPAQAPETVAADAPAREDDAPTLG